MKYFCTLSDYNYLAKGLALYKSLKKNSSESFLLYYLYLDERTKNALEKLNFPELKIIGLSEIENKELKIARTDRSYTEFCYTLASYFLYYLINTLNIDHMTYIDSDIFFYKDPDIIYKEIKEKSVGIIAHRHNSVGSDQDGTYNVGVVYFKNNEMGKKVLFWWMDAVLNKLYPEYYGCGDQRYLEGFIPRFGEENICIADRTFGHGAPWNYRLYSFDKINEGLIIWNSIEQPFVFNHFSRLTYDLGTNWINYTSGMYVDHTLNYAVFNNSIIQDLYKNYCAVLRDIYFTWLVNT